jgi:hypothetical protein
MNTLFINLLVSIESFIDHFFNALSILVSGDTEMPLADIFFLSRVLFAVMVVVLYVQYFDRVKAALFPVKTTVSHRYYG